MPIFFSCLEICPLKKSDLRSLDFVIDRLLNKLFKTKKNSVRDSQHFIADTAGKFVSDFTLGCRNLLYVLSLTEYIDKLVFLIFLLDLFVCLSTTCW